MKTAFFITLFILGLGLSVPVGVLYHRYRNTPARLWLSRLRNRRDELETRRQVLLRGPEDPDEDLEALRDELFDDYLQNLPVSIFEHSRCPGIGPATVQKLRQVGVHSLLDMRERRFLDIPGIGQRKDQELCDARDYLFRQYESVFNAGGCQQGSDYRARSYERQVAYQQACARYQLELVAVERALVECDRLERICGDLTFLNYAFGKPNNVPESVLSSPLPEIEIKVTMPPPPVVPTAPPVLAAVPVLARKDPAPMVLPPRAVEPKKIESTDPFGELLNQTAVKPTPVPGTELPGRVAMRTLAGFGLMVAKADGRIAQAERKAVRGYLETRFGGDAVLVRFIDVTLEEAEKAIPAEADAVSGLLAVVGEAERPAVFAWAEHIAGASGERNAKETELLERLRGALGVPVRPERTVSVSATEPKPSVVPSRTPAAPKSDSRSLLDIAPEVELSVDLIRRRFALLTEKLDPLKAAAMGAEFAQLAEEKRAKLKAAAEELLKPFGEPLEKPTAPTPTDLRHNPDLDAAFGM